MQLNVLFCGKGRVLSMKFGRIGEHIVESHDVVVHSLEAISNRPLPFRVETKQVTL